MSEATLDPMWVPNNILPATFLIVGVEDAFENTKRGQYQYYKLGLMRFGQQYVYDAKYGDKNLLINTLGKKTEGWIGHEIGMHIPEGSKYKQLQPITRNQDT